jgi:tetratricopeptide (TPR) repeat protein
MSAQLTRFRPRPAVLAFIGLIALSVFVGQPVWPQSKSTSSSGFNALAQRADAARDAEHLDEAVGLYRKALGLRPSWKEGWWSLGTILYDQNSFAPAAQVFRKLLTYDARNGTAHLMLGLCEYQLDQDDAAVGQIRFAKKLGIRKDDQLLHVLQYHEAMLQLRKGHFESAQAVLRSLVAEGVHSDELNAALGMGALMLRPKDAPAEGTDGHALMLRVGSAESLNLQRKADEAQAAYKSLVQENPNFPNIHYAYARLLLGTQDADAAIAEFQQEIKNNPANVHARLQIASSYYRTDSRAGIPFAREAVELQPGYPFGHYLLGLLYFDSGDNEHAIPELEKAAQLVPQESQFYFALGNAYAKAGRKQEASRARAKFVRLRKGTDERSGPSVCEDAQALAPRQMESTPSPP